MPRRPQPDDDYTEADRRAIAEIRRKLDAEFGPLEPAEPLMAEPPPPPRPRRPRRADGGRAALLFLLGALVGGATGGITGSTTALLWLEYLERRPDGAAVSSADAARVASDSPAAAAREPRSDRTALDAALNAWLEATKAGDIERQMQFYPDRVPVYYTWRNVSRQAVREEKRRVFGAATRLEISTDVPTTELGDQGAVSRFRKRYVIEGPTVRRRGEVVQELRWARTPDGWRIVSERDAEVVTPRRPELPRRSGTIGPTR